MGYNQFLKRRLKSLEKKRLKRKNRASIHIRYEDHSERHIINKDMFVSVVPSNFSIIENSLETIRYFNNLIHSTLRSNSVHRVFFQFEDVCHITPDALIYLLAILKFAKCSIREFSGNLPKAPKPREVFVQSGFLKKISNSRVPVDMKTNNYLMCAGNVGSVDDTKLACQFLHAHSDATRIDTSFIYDMLMELEVNTTDHAYGENANPLFERNWIACIEDAGETFKFTFLDVGAGICKTIYKRWHESINIGKTHADYLLSAFNGVLLRSKTKMPNRGKGLPKIKQYADAHLIQHLTVVTNKAICKANDSNDMFEARRLGVSLAGSVYYWEVSKHMFRKEGEKAA